MIISHLQTVVLHTHAYTSAAATGPNPVFRGHLSVVENILKVSKWMKGRRHLYHEVRDRVERAWHAVRAAADTSDDDKVRTQPSCRRRPRDKNSSHAVSGSFALHQHLRGNRPAQISKSPDSVCNGLFRSDSQRARQQGEVFKLLDEVAVWIEMDYLDLTVKGPNFEKPRLSKDGAGG